MPRKAPPPAKRPELHPARVDEAFDRLARQRALQTLVRGALPLAVLKRLLKNALSRREASEMPDEVWSSLAASIALENEVFREELAQVLHDRLAWDREPDELDAWWPAVRERPLEALWMAAASESKTIKKEFQHLAAHCLDNFRASPECVPPSWEFVEGLLDVQAKTEQDLRDSERELDDAERRVEAERARLEDMREELKRLRRENSELRSAKAQAERRAQAIAEERGDDASAEDARRIEDLERRLRKLEKERAHLELELSRAQSGSAPARPQAAGGDEPDLEPAAEEIGEELATQPSLSADPNPRRRVLRQMLRKLVKKGKIGASHTHEDNVYRGVADHEKGVAKEAMDLLYREGFLVPKPTTTDPHVSLRPDRLAEVRAIVAGEVANPRLLRFIEG